MGDTAKSVVLVKPGELAVREIPVPRVPPPSLRVSMRACGICGSDLRYLAGENPWSLHTLGRSVPSPPNMVLGHEVSGVIRKGGRDVRIAVLAYKGCGTCRACRSGRENICANVQHIGHATGWGKMEYYPGGMAEEFEVWEGFAYEIPDSISFEEATFLDGLAVAVHACDRAHISRGNRVAVIGLGPIGMMAAQVARDRGAEVVTGCDTTPLPVELAGSLGFETMEMTDGALLFGKAVDSGIEYDAVIDTVGDVGAVEAAFGVLAPGGVISLLSVHDATIPLDSMRLSAERYVTTSANSPYRDFRTAITLLETGRVAVAPLVTHRFPLSEAVRAFEVMADKEKHRAYKIVLVP